MSESLGFAARVAARAQRWSSAPTGERELWLAKRAFLDTIGVAAAGWRLRSPRILVDALDVRRADGDGRVIASEMRAAPADAALVNGLLAHAQLFDDNSDPMIAHPSGPLVAVALALGPRVRAGGAALCSAYAAGFDASVVIGRLLNPEHYERGWHTTATVGIFGATVVAATLLGATTDELIHALGIAASSAAGLRQNFGSMTMGYHAGNAARAAMVAALLARDGFTASRDAFAGRSGFFEAFGPARDATAALEEGEHELVRSGIQFKLFASGAPTLCAIEAALALVPFIDGPIESVTCEVDPWYEKTLKEGEPRDGFEAKVNLRYCVATAFIRGRLGLDEFEPDAVDDPAVRALMRRIVVRVDPALTNGGTFPARVRVRTNGRDLAAERRHPRGAPQVPPADADLIHKFTACLRDIAGAPEAARMAERILGFDLIEGDELYDLLALSPEMIAQTRSSLV